MSVFELQPRIAEEIEFLDEQTFSDPFGLGYRLTVLRASHPDWETWRKKHLDERGGVLETVLKKAYVETLSAQEPRPGFRRRKRAKLGGDDLKKAIAGAISEVDLVEAQKEDLEALRPGIAEVLLRRLTLKKDDVVHDADLAGKLRFLESDPKNRIPEGQNLDYEGNTVGDALVLYILDCSEYADAYRSDWVEDASKNSPDTPGGSNATGHPSSGETSEPSSAARS